MARKRAPTDDAVRALRAFGLTYPGAHLKSPWPGHADLAVNDKTFAYLTVEGEPLRISCKLPESSEVALLLPGCVPTAYGLGKSGWVSMTFTDRDVPIAMLQAWIDESYRAQAPRKLVAALDAGAAPTKKPIAKRPVAKKPAAKRPVAKKPATKKPATKRPATKKPAAKKPAARRASR